MKICLSIVENYKHLNNSSVFNLHTGDYACVCTSCSVNTSEYEQGSACQWMVLLLGNEMGLVLVTRF